MCSAWMVASFGTAFLSSMTMMATSRKSYQAIIFWAVLLIAWILIPSYFIL